MLLINVYNETGELIKEHKLDEIIGTQFYRKYVTPPDRWKSVRKSRQPISFPLPQEDIRFRNNKFYVMDYHWDMEAERGPTVMFDKLVIHVLDKECNLVKRINIPLEDKLKSTLGLSVQFEIINKNEDLLISFLSNSEVYRFFSKKF